MKSESDERAEQLTRRQFVAAGALGGAALAIGCKAGERGNWEYLSDGQAGRSRPSATRCSADGFPSASQAGVLTYIDRQLCATTAATGRPIGMAWSRRTPISRKRFGRSGRSAPTQQQFEVVSASRSRIQRILQSGAQPHA